MSSIRTVFYRADHEAVVDNLIIVAPEDVLDDVQARVEAVNLHRAVPLCQSE